MDDFNFIKQKLAEFTRRFYINELLRGVILFSAIWLLYLILVLLVEYFFWLSPQNRTVLFWIFIAVSAGLLFKFILIPLGKLLKLSKGIDSVEASRIIGKHFPEVNDKLLNVLQLQNSADQSDLLLAGIAQKSKELKPVPFKLAVDYKTSLRYVKYAVFPVLIIVAFLITGNYAVFSESYTRVVNYKTAYEPPAPFSFIVEKDQFEVEEGKSLNLKVETLGKIVPETVAIHYNNETYFLRSNGTNKFIYEFPGMKNGMDFYLSSNGVTSKSYQIKVVKVPKLVDFEMTLKFPAYIKKKEETLKGTGNVNVPEGTVVSWNLNTRTTEEVSFTTRDSVRTFERDGESFRFSEAVYNNTAYQIKTSNAAVKDYEALEYEIAVIKDQYPEIDVRSRKDSINEENIYFLGKVSDDYAISAVNLVYFTVNEEEAAIKVEIPIEKQAFSEFLYAFPGTIPLEKGKDYNLYFEVFDNDGVRGSKRSKSEIFSFRKKSDKEVEEEKLNQQGESIQNLTQSLEKMELSEKELQEFSELQKQKEQLNYNDRKKLDNFLERQKQQTEMMKNYSEKLKESLENETEPAENDEFKEELKERLERNEQRLEENEELMEELKKYSDKINREELAEKLEKLSKQNNSEKKSLEQLLELTKRYYVQEKTQKLARDLEELAEEQIKLSENDSINSEEKQKELSEEFKEFKEKMEDLDKENDELKKPMDLGRDEEGEEQIQNEQEKAEENLKEENKEGAKKNQQKAGEKMKEQSAKMKAAQAMGQGEQLNANIESMRQILSNLMVFSFEQEDLLLNFREIRINNPAYAKELKKQQVLKEHFQHIDDSIFALALNNPMINEKITSKLTDIEFDIDKSLERLAENQLPQGTASQQYVMTGTNELALMLDNVLENMQEMANPSGGSGGGGEGIQLPDIIQSQEELNEQMQKGMEEGEGESSGEGEGEEEKEGDGEGEGKDGENGEDGEGGGEDLNGKLFEIYKQQQMLRLQLEDKLRKLGLDEKNTELLKEMEQIEKDVLDKGFSNETLKKMNRITHKLLDLEDAVLEQDEEERRTSRTNRENYQNNSQDHILKAKEYFNSTEILNRQTLPLRQIYKLKVKQYFEAVEN